MRTTPLLLIGAAAAIALGVSACSSDAGSSPAGNSAGSTPASTTTTSVAPTTTVTAAPSTTSTVTTTTSTDSGDSGSSGGGSGPGACAESQLRATIDSRHIPGNGTKGSNGKLRHGVLVDFLNKSASTCTLTGYPGAAIEDSGNKQIQQAKRTLKAQFDGTPSKVRTVTLKPTTSAVALLDGVDTKEQGAAQAGCDDSPYPRILVTPPNTKIAVPFSVGWPKCYSFQVHPVQAKSGS